MGITASHHRAAECFSRVRPVQTITTDPTLMSIAALAVIAAALLGMDVAVGIVRWASARRNRKSK